MNKYVRKTSKKYKNAKKSLSNIIRKNNRYGKNGKHNGKETRDKRMQVLYKLLDDLHLYGYEIQDIKLIKQKHFIVIFDMWLNSSIKASVIQNSLSQFRRLCEWIKKPQLVNEALDNYSKKEEFDIRRKREGKNDRKIKSFSGQSVSVLGAFERVSDIDFIVSSQMFLMYAFGLRRKEAAMFRPMNDINDDGTINVIKGAKGGRPRYNITPIEQGDDVAEFLVSLKELVKDKYSTSTIPKHLTYKQWEGYVSRVMIKAGITKEQLGVTLHGLRHEYLQSIYQGMSGKLPRLLIEKGLHHITFDQDKVIKGVVSQLAGHERPEITEHYGI